ncbi:Hypothetical protein Tpal_64 [Trichococcus palustris]|uniref:Uncharacterized protein n=1 Tax=Trichococcus palustris TaxID=140314 RepID=A0A143Y5R8_9LACT|nr:Hypothetical protein Tpal_64 [Trichococcus palustris]
MFQKEELCNLELFFFVMFLKGFSFWCALLTCYD